MLGKTILKRGLKFVFLWHWQKRLTREKNAVFAVPDSLINAIGRLSSEYSVKIVALSKTKNYNVYSPEQNIDYVFRKSLKKIIAETTQIDPDFLLINHHPYPYEELQKKLNFLRAKKIIYYSAPINELNEYHRKMDCHIVHHEYQKEILKKKGINPEKIFIAPKTADMKIFKPMAVGKKWDCIYPMRGTIGYWKRPELAIKACKLNNMSIIMPGAKIPSEYYWVTTPNEWKTPEELTVLYNQSKCLVITSNESEMGPRVIPEAAACNIPIVCCSDSPACVSHVKKIGGFVAEPDPEDIAEKIKLAIQEKVNTRQRLIELGFDYDLIYRILSGIIKNFVETIIGSEKNLRQHWEEKYKTDLKKWKDDWRLILYEWVLEDIMDDKCSIIDIGSGPGYGLERIKKIRPNVDVCGVDFSTEAEKRSVIPFVKKDIIKDSLSSLSADYVLCIETLEHFKNPYYVLDRIIPIAKKKVILTVPYKENISNHTEHESVFSKKSFREYNIENIKIERRGKGKIMKVVINTSKKATTIYY